ncbi:pentatricopeptide repeat-containing protein At1g12300, mitochondrial-like [Pistacia vera]|uniref:pentatricopeptide repeat-containing protein At1g12300, mitochondrial-like n=1 Tax=Pistacia vera TaxID=55513 RepID=UPI001262FF9B|nr:pentatricopeptide repeat-containing protein At1g12300, mitochondrial-like [Pistacia vera]
MVVVGCRPSAITYGTLIDGLCKTEEISLAIKLYEEMVNGNDEFGVICRSNVVIYSTIIDGLIELDKEVNQALYLYRKMIYEEIRPDVIIYSTLLTGLFLIAKVGDARNLIGDMTTLQPREIWFGVTYAVAVTMIHGDLVDIGFQIAIEIYEAAWFENGVMTSFY